MARALLVIDVQKGMFSVPAFQPFDGEAVVARIAQMIAAARASGTAIFFVQHDGGPGHPLSAECAGFPFREEVAPRTNDIVIVKRRCSAFQDTALEEKLRAAGIDSVIVCGMQTEYCVDTAVRAAFERGFAVTLVADAHTTGDTAVLHAKDIVAHHNATLTNFAAVVPAAEIGFTR
jgi:nicotinamidase-related amidase